MASEAHFGVQRNVTSGTIESRQGHGERAAHLDLFVPALLHRCLAAALHEAYHLVQIGESEARANVVKFFFLLESWPARSVGHGPAWICSRRARYQRETAVADLRKDRRDHAEHRMWRVVCDGVLHQTQHLEGY